ncbi:hypothetical protein PPERSA_04373 [Pseudocohnilembus persalinus]|uniref:Uncharacterized protein n=1 Tax=Pseudocohnilembus persalinus TaxID=266149 RepID=A0A0V0QQH4_PSEPJ|nr:hypothetical protein PPERSA_04373 [Pseudocohnilembus persalinus]|eukprot:KRX04558.1 hypothetical protein PPERSA_04373 [Pseudocohnilembus persalinus]
MEEYRMNKFDPFNFFEIDESQDVFEVKSVATDWKFNESYNSQNYQATVESYTGSLNNLNYQYIQYEEFQNLGQKIKIGEVFVAPENQIKVEVYYNIILKKFIFENFKFYPESTEFYLSEDVILLLEKNIKQIIQEQEEQQQKHMKIKQLLQKEESQKNSKENIEIFLVTQYMKEDIVVFENEKTGLLIIKDKYMDSQTSSPFKKSLSGSKFGKSPLRNSSPYKKKYQNYSDYKLYEQDEFEQEFDSEELVDQYEIQQKQYLQHQNSNSTRNLPKITEEENISQELSSKYNTPSFMKSKKNSTQKNLSDIQYKTENKYNNINNVPKLSQFKELQSQFSSNQKQVLEDENLDIQSLEVFCQVDINSIKYLLTNLQQQQFSNSQNKMKIYGKIYLKQEDNQIVYYEIENLGICDLEQQNKIQKNYLINIPHIVSYFEDINIQDLVENRQFYIDQQLIYEKNTGLNIKNNSNLSQKIDLVQKQKQNQNGNKIEICEIQRQGYIINILLNIDFKILELKVHNSIFQIEEFYENIEKIDKNLLNMQILEQKQECLNYVSKIKDLIYIIDKYEEKILKKSIIVYNQYQVDQAMLIQKTFKKETVLKQINFNLQSFEKDTTNQETNTKIEIQNKIQLVKIEGLIKIIQVKKLRQKDTYLFRIIQNGNLQNEIILQQINLDGQFYKDLENFLPNNIFYQNGIIQIQNIDFILKSLQS